MIELKDLTKRYDQFTAVDEVTADEAVTHYFHTKEEALEFAGTTAHRIKLRDTSLEDVFIERAGRKLS